MAGELSLDVAAAWLGAVYGALIAEKGQLGEGSLPGWMTPRRRRPLRFTLSSKIDVAIARAIHPDITQGYARADSAMVLRRQVYERSLRTFLPACATALRGVTNDGLSRQEEELRRLSTRFARPGVEDDLHESAKRIWWPLRETLPGGVDVPLLTESTGEQPAQAESEILPGGVKEPSAPQKTSDRQIAPPADFVNRQRLLAAIKSERDALEQRGAVETSRLLATIAVHPQAKEIMRLYVASPLKGTDRIKAEIGRAVAATADLRKRLTAPETEDDAWGYAPLVVGAVVQLRLNEVPGLPEFAVAMGRLLAMTNTTVIIGGATMLMIALSIPFIGPLGAVVVGTLDLALAGTDVGITLLQMHEQEIAATATNFQPDENKLATHPDGFDAALGIAAAFLSAIFLAGAARRLLKTRPRPPEVLKSTDRTKVPPAKAPDPRAVSHRGIEAEAVTATDPGIAGLGTEIAPPGVGSKIDTAPPLKASGEVRTIREEAPTPGVSKQERLTSERGIQATSAAPARPIVPPELISTNVHLSGDTANTGGITRIWAHREPDGTLAFRIDGELGDALPRPHPNTPDFNREPPPGSMIGLPDYEIAHLWGPGFGDEARDGMMYAPREMNQVFQNRFIESRLRELHTLARRQGATIKLTASAKSYPLKTWRGHEMLKEVSYDFQVRLADGTTLQIGRVEITVPPPRSTDRFTVQVSPGSAAVWSLL